MPACVLTISTSVAARERDDESGPLAARLLDEAGHNVSAMEVIPDDLPLIEDRIHHYVDEGFTLIVTTGGTGPAVDDVTPEATRAAIERPAPGLAAAVRASRGSGPAAMLHRGVAGFSDRTLIVNLPGDPDAVQAALIAIAPAIDAAIEALLPQTGER